MSSLPTDIISLIFNPANHVKTFLIMLKLLKLIRLSRLSRVITYLNFKSNVKMSLRLGQLIFFLILYLHLVGWTWFYIVRQDETWIPPLDENNNGTDIYLESGFSKYITSVYYSVLLLAGNDMLPQGNEQLIFSTVMLFAAAIINANIFGNIAVLLQQIYRKSSLFQEKLENATSTMKNLKIPENLSKRIQDFLTSTQSILDQQTEFDNFLRMLSPSLRIEVAKHIFHSALLSNDIFEGKIEIIDYIIHDLNTVLFFPENEIWRQGSTGKELYFLAKGEVDVFVMDEYQQNKFIKTLHPGSYFGEVAILKEWPRTATVMSQSYSTCASLEKQNFIKLLERYSFLRKSLELKISVDYEDRWRKFVERSLRNVEYFDKTIPDEIVKEISYKLELKNIPKDEYLFKSGNPWKKIIIISSGRVEILISNRDNNESYLDTIYSGCSVGSYGVLKADYYFISGKALTESTYLTLDNSVLDQMRGEYEELDDNLFEYEEYINENGLPYWDYKLQRGKDWNISPIEKFQNGINRIIRIVKSYKATTFTNVLKKVQDHIKRERNIKLRKGKNKIIKANPQNFEEKIEKLILEQSLQIQKLTEVVASQTTQITQPKRWNHFKCKEWGILNEITENKSFKNRTNCTKIPQNIMTSTQLPHEFNIIQEYEGIITDNNKNEIQSSNTKSLAPQIKVEEAIRKRRKYGKDKINSATVSPLPIIMNSRARVEEQDIYPPKDYSPLSKNYRLPKSRFCLINEK